MLLRAVLAATALVGLATASTDIRFSCLSTILNNTGTKAAAKVIGTAPGGTVAACCAACSANPLCQVWTLNTNDSPTKCSLKGELSAKLRPGQDKGCTTGLRPPSPPPPPSPPSPPPPPSPADHPWQVFTPDEVRQCGKIRIPELTVTPSRIIVWAQCRSANTSGSAAAPAGPPRLGDNMVHAKVVSKASSDNGASWTNWTVHTPVQYSHGKAIFDRVARQVVLQYQHHPNADPELNSSYFQRVSKDDGLSWGPERDITDQLEGCNPYVPMQPLFPLFFLLNCSRDIWSIVSDIAAPELFTVHMIYGQSSVI